MHLFLQLMLHMSKSVTRCINGEVVSESESDDPEEYLNVRSSQHINDAGKKIILKKRNAIKWQARRFRAKAIAERRFLSRKVSKRVSKIVRDCPNIGETIEAFVKDHSVGADAWCRTGVLTFDGNANLRGSFHYSNTFFTCSGSSSKIIGDSL